MSRYVGSSFDLHGECITVQKIEAAGRANVAAEVIFTCKTFHFPAFSHENHEPVNYRSPKGERLPTSTSAD